MKTAHKKPQPKLTKRNKAPQPAALPTREALLAYIDQAASGLGLREIARAFNVAPEHKKTLRGLIRGLEGEGLLERAARARSVDGSGLARNALAKNTPGNNALPENAMVRITGIDRNGEALAQPVNWQGKGRPPVIFMQGEARGRAALAPGARVLARLRRIGPDRYEGKTLKRFSEQTGSIIGIFRAEGAGGRIEPVDRRQRMEWLVHPGDTQQAASGELVRAEPVPAHGFGPKPARVTQVLGQAGGARSVSMIAIATHQIPTDFSAAALAQAARARATRLGRRTDLRDIPLITIDGADARDFDDAVFAEPLARGGHRLVVAIADVAHYVKPGSALDDAARERGNSCYFPDRVVPMLPEALSNGWCSLKPEEDRGCLFVDMSIDAQGRKTSHRFGRGLMRSHARLTYEQVQETHERDPARFGALYAAFEALLAARKARGTLDLDLPERKIELSASGEVLKIAPRPRLNSHRLIEEFMILANVAAAEELERLRYPCMYRVHAPPSPEKLDALRSFLGTLDISLPRGDTLHPRDLDRVLKQVAGTDQAPLVNETVLRSLSQAEYSPENIGHFGLGLPRYAHFTSPIRRYADLLVHRALIGCLSLGEDGFAPEDAARFAETAEHITGTERRATLAERDSTDRYLALYLQHRIGELFEGRISGVTKFGLFVTLLENGASGFAPMASLPDDFWILDESSQSLTGKHSKFRFQLAQPVSVRLREARPVTGGLIFQVVPPVLPARGKAPKSGKEQARPRARRRLRAKQRP